MLADMRTHLPRFDLSRQFWFCLVLLLCAGPLAAAPVLLNSFSPASGPPGTAVTLYGSGFAQSFTSFAVSFNGTPVTSYSLLSDTQIQVVVPPTAATGPIAVIAHLLAAQYNLVSAAAFTVTPPPPPAPKISSFSPASGAVGTAVTIQGGDLTGATIVKFAGAAASSLVVNSAASITAYVPAGAVTGPLSVTTPGGTATSAASFTVLAATPVITAFTPGTGPANTAVTITGANFTGATAVRFNGVASGYYAVNSDTQITAYVPSAAGSGPIQVTTPSGSALSAGSFQVTVVIPPPTISLVAPANGPPGTAVTVTGQNFAGTTGVTFNGVAAVFTVTDGMHLTATVPAAATTGPLAVTTPGGTATTLGNFTVTAAGSPPVVTGFSPGSGLSGAYVAVQGSGFVGVTAVRFGGVAANFTVDSATQISTHVPVGAATGPISVVSGAGTGVSSGAFTVIPPPPAPVITFINPASGLPGLSIKVQGVHLTGATLVTFNGAGAVFTVLDDSDISATVPAGAASGPVYVTTPGGTAASPGSFTVLAPPPLPVITSFAPPSGRVGSVVILNGANFTGATSVTFGGVATAFNVSSATEIDAYVPFGAVTGPVSVTTPNGRGTSANSFVVTAAVANPPSITSISPNSGMAGDTVTIHGSSLAAVGSVAFNGTPAAFYITADDTIVATVPAAATTGYISANSAQGGGQSSDVFTVLASAALPVVTSMSVSNGVAGDVVSLYGDHLGGVTMVNFFDAVQGSRAAAFTVLGDTELQATVPAGAASGYVTVVANGYYALSPAAFTINDAALPVLFGFQPAAGHAGDLLVITGTGLNGVLEVAIGGRSVPFQTISATEIDVTLPRGGFSGLLGLTSPQGVVYSTTEFNALQEPLTNPGALFQALAPALTDAGMFSFSFPTEVGHGYQVRFATTLNPDAWRPKRVIPPQAAGGMVSITEPIRPTGAAFYQIVTDSPTVALDNWDFEFGLSQWTASGDAFTNQPTYGDCLPTASIPGAGGTVGGDYWNVPYPVGHHGGSWICTGINHMDDSPAPTSLDHALDGLVGTLTSREFRLGANFISFLIGGGRDIFNLRVEFQILEPDAGLRYNLGGIWGTDGNFAIVSVFTGTDHEQLRREVWDATAYSGRIARIRILDNSTTKHINVDDFRFVPVDPSPTLQRTAWGDFVDPDAPVWGVADTHTHPMVHLAYGGELIAGQPDGPFETALADCSPHHGIDGTGLALDAMDLGVDNALFGLFESSMPGLPLIPFSPGHRTGGASGAYDGWPSFVSKSHEQMHVEFIRRAWQGGLRLMVAHAVNTELLGHEFGGPTPQPYDDPSSALAQIQAMTQLVAAHSDFMGIARTPAEARAIIRGNRLAVILGIEEDSFGGFRNENGCTDQQVADYVQQVYDLGVRHVFPLHVANNAFGGCGLYEDQWGLNNYYLRNENVAVLPAPPATIQFRMGEDAPIQIGVLSWALVGYFPPDYNSLFTAARADTGYFPGHMNARGLTERGTNLLYSLMRKGMIIDVDHMGWVTRNAALSLMEAQNYPVIDGHCTFTEMAWRRGQTLATGKLGHESDTTPELAERIRALGGMIGVITVAKDNQAWGGVVPNDCPGTAKSWAQQYLYALEHLDGQNVALATDFQLVNNSGPRFGVNTCFALQNKEQSMHDDLRTPLFNQFAAAQNNGVAYDRPISDYRAYRFQNYHGMGYYDGSDRDTFNALAIAAAMPASGETPDTAWQPDAGDHFLPFFGLLGPAARIRSLAWGFAGQIFDDDSSAAYLAYNADALGTVITDPAVVKLKRIADIWKAMNGTNAPLQRYTMPPVAIANDPGNHVITRDWDINLDGFAHYGMLPDFLQDLSNSGLSRDKMAPQFHSAEDYIRMWEKCLQNRLN